MKKLIVIMLAVCGLSVAASEYMVYDFTMTAKTTKAKGVTTCGKTTNCGACGECGFDETASSQYVWRDKASYKIRGIIAGCGCASILANGSCDDALVLLWNETTKQQITNFTFSTWIVQRIGKKGASSEHIAKIETDDFEVTLGGLGEYKKHHTKISGNFAGVAAAPYLVTPGLKSVCYEEPGTSEQSSALAPCEDGCGEAENADVTPYFGSYTLKYNSKKSKKVAKKNNLTAKALGCPSYVDINLGLSD